MSPKPKAQLAREHLNRALGDLYGDEVEVVMWLFQAAEAAIDGLARQHGIDTKRRHDLKAEAARTLHEQGVLHKDYSDVLELLNEGRKDTAYEGDPLNLGNHTIEDLDRMSRS